MSPCGVHSHCNLNVFEAGCFLPPPSVPAMATPTSCWPGETLALGASPSSRPFVRASCGHCPCSEADPSCEAPVVPRITPSRFGPFIQRDFRPPARAAGWMSQIICEQGSQFSARLCLSQCVTSPQTRCDASVPCSLRIWRHPSCGHQHPPGHPFPAALL